jgi:hypothetical protein
MMKEARLPGTTAESLSAIAVAIALLACFVADPGYAQSVEAEESDSQNFDAALDELSIDSASSIGDAVERRGLSLDGDLRIGDIIAGDDFSAVRLDAAEAIRARWRIRSTWAITERFRGVLRVAGLCSTSDCDPDFVVQPHIATGSSMKDGQITLDEFFLQWFRSHRFNVAVGRMQIKSVARGGVFSKSLDQNNSNNLRINWTDGLHSTFKARNGWESHMVLQYNSEDGPSTVRREPLDFSDSGSRVSYLFGFENLQEKRRLVQRALDVNYFPASLLINGQADGRLEDYLAIVARAALRWPIRSESWRLRLSSEVGYAPDTPTKAATGITGMGDTDGLAWNITASVMDFVPNHSIGINYGQTGAGWLVSPQYTNNERLFEIRYMWRPTDRLSLDIRGRWRDELLQTIIVDPDRNRFDFYIRFTWTFKIKES